MVLTIDMCNNNCGGCYDSSLSIPNQFIYQKKILKQTGVSSSIYNSNLTAFSAVKNQSYSNSTASDRARLSNMNLVIRRNTSSLTGSRTSLKPGCLSAGGKGVDVKHNSYDRYLAKLKGKTLKQITTSTAPIYGNKTSNIPLFSYSKTQCNNC